MIDERNSEVQVGTQVRLCLRDSHADGVPGVGSGAGEVGEEPPVDVVNLRAHMLCSHQLGQEPAGKM